MKMDFGTWAFKNRKLVSLFVVVLIVGGIFSYYKMPKLEDPEIIVRQALVVGIYPGSSAHQIELEVADPLEKSIRETAGVDYVESRCYSDMCIIKISLLTTVPQDEITQVWDIMRHKVDQTELPAGASTMIRDDFGDVFGMFYAISGEDFTSKQLTDYVDMIRREVQNVKGVSRVGLYGVPAESIHINLQQDRLVNLGVLPLEVIQTLTGQNATVYSGYFLSGGNRIRVTVDDRYRSVEDIANLIIQGHEDDQIRLSDLAVITREETAPIREYMERDGARAIGLSISAVSGTDIVKVGRAVEKKMKELQKTKIPVGLNVDKVFYQPERVSSAMNSFMMNLMLSVLLVILVLIFAMGLRSGLVIGASLATIVSGSILILYYTGGTLQRVSLSSFILAMGMLVDNAIVIVDGILVAKAEGKPKMEALTSIGKHTAMPLLGATLIAILSFLPIFLSPDVTGVYVHDMFIVLAVSLILSWVLALTHVPVMAERWIYPQPVKSTEEQRNGKPYQWLRKALTYLLDNKKLTLGVLVGLLAMAGVGASFMPRALFPDLEYDQLYMEYKLPESRNYTQVKQDLYSIRAYLEKRPEVTHVVTSLGGTPARYNLVRSIHNPSLAYGELIIDFKSARALKKNIRNLQAEVSAMFPDAFVRFKRYNLMFMPYPIQLNISGPDPEVLADLKSQCLKIFNESGVCECITDEWEPSVPTLVVGYDQAMARYAGLSRQEVGMSLLASTDGIPIGSFYEGSHPLDLYVNCVEADGTPLKNLNEATVFGIIPDVVSLSTSVATGALNLSDALNLSGTIGRNEPLRQVSDGLRVEWEESSVCRYNGQRAKMLCAFPAAGHGTEDARKAIAKQLDEIEVPDGYSLTWNGERLAEDMSMANLFKYYPMALLLMLTILLILFNNYKTVALLVCSLPVIFVGVVPAILLSGSTFGFVAIVGLLGLVGMIFKNGIILVDEINLQVSRNDDMTQALIDASISRLRPVTMAAFTTVLGMVPLLFDSMFKSLAATIIGGLLVGTVIVLLLIPVLYSLLFKNGIKRSDETETDITHNNGQ